MTRPRRPKTGRPTRDPGGRVATERIEIRVTPAQRDQLARLAAASGAASLSEYVIAAALEVDRETYADRERLQMLASAIRDTVTRYAGEE